MILRRYQADCVDSIIEAFESGMKRPAVVAPTGSGKTVIFSALVQRLVAQRQRPLILVDRNELVSQTVNKLRATDSTMSIGIIKAARNEGHGDVTVASIQTLSRVARLHSWEPTRFTHIVADECHMAAADGWKRVLDYFDAPAVGFTATMMRADSKGLGEVWERVIWERDLKWAISAGFLMEPRALTVRIPELAYGRTRDGDFNDSDLGKAMAQAKAGPIIAQAYNDKARDESGALRRGILFAPTVETAVSFAQDFRAAGIPTEVVVGTTPAAERKRIYEATHRGENIVIASVGVLTTGFDLPAVEVAVIARPTKSKGLYIQVVGRVLRPSPDTFKRDALILDVVGSVRLGLASVVDLKLDRPEDGVDEDGNERVPGGREMAGLPPEVPDDIELIEVDPHDGVRKKLARRAASRRWLFATNKTPFLPGMREGESDIFLHPENDGTWTVGELPSKGRALRHEEGLPFPLAVEAAVNRYPVPPKLTGTASDAQLGMLARLTGEAIDTTLDRQEASERIAIELFSRRIGAK